MKIQIVLFGLMAFACAGGGTTNETRPTETTEVPANLQMDKEFLTDAASGGKFEVESARIALSKHATMGTTDLAQALIRDHSQANEKLADLANEKAVDLPEGMLPEHQSKLAQLQSAQGEQFDRMFENIQAQAHQDAIALFERCARYCQDLDVRQFAADTLPTLRDHMRHVQQLQASARAAPMP